MSRAWAKGSDARWRAFRKTILDRDRWLCRIGGASCTSRATQVDHIVQLSHGGAKYDPANCRAACAPCNEGHKRAPITDDRPVRRVSSW